MLSASTHYSQAINVPALFLDMNGLWMQIEQKYVMKKATNKYETSIILHRNVQSLCEVNIHIKLPALQITDPWRSWFCHLCSTENTPLRNALSSNKCPYIISSTRLVCACWHKRSMFEENNTHKNQALPNIAFKYQKEVTHSCYSHKKTLP